MPMYIFVHFFSSLSNGQVTCNSSCME